MTKNALLVLIMSWGFHVYAQPEYVGTWCQYSDDFTRILTIDSDGLGQEYSVGKSNEVVPAKSVEVNMGANHFEILMNGVDIGVVDFKVRKATFSDRQVLILYKRNEKREKYKECKVKFGK